MSSQLLMCWLYPLDPRDLRRRCGGPRTRCFAGVAAVPERDLRAAAGLAGTLRAPGMLALGFAGEVGKSLKLV